MKIKSLILLSGFILFLVSCNENGKTEDVDYVLFSGKIDNTIENEISVYGNSNNFNKIIPIQPNGTFSDTLKIEQSGSYSFIIGRERSNMYLKQGDQLELSIDTEKFDESIIYKGNAANVNNYLAEKFLVEESFMKDGPEGYEKLFSKKAIDFKEEILKQKQTKNEVLKKYKNLDSEFIAAQTKENHYEYLSILNEYTPNHRYITKNVEYQTPQGFLEELNDFNIDIAEDFNSSNAYKRLSTSIFYRISEEKADNDSISFSKALMDNLATVKSKNIRNSLIKNIAYEVSPENENAAELYSLLMETSEDEEFKNELTTKFEKIKLLVKGNESPVFSNYENHQGGTTSLNDLKGKYVYIDVWATWCAPCKAEIPYLKKIEEQYHDKNIEFVSISVDQKPQYDTWKSMVKDEELRGIQLFADQNWSSQFIIDYDIKGIPRFILIDPNGKIVSASAPRPSDPKLLEVFEGLDI